MIKANEIYVIRIGFKRLDFSLVDTYTIAVSKNLEAIKATQDRQNKSMKYGIRYVEDAEPLVLTYSKEELQLQDETRVWFPQTGYEGFKRYITGLSEEEYHDLYWVKDGI